jgi:glycosyltransferase involved in cell wall biosynthesis
MATRRILVVTYPYPPMPSVGGNRWLAMTKYLRRRGHQVDILTTSAFGVLPDDAQSGVHRSTDLIAAKWLRKLARRPPLPEPGSTAAIDKPPQAYLTRILVPDIYIATWVPYATRAARDLVSNNRYDCIVTTSAYESAHLVGLGLGRRRPAWIADFRDGWTFHPWRPPFPTAAQRRLDAWLERTVVRSAERTIVVERPVGEDFRRRLAVDAGYVPNGWDPDLEREAASTNMTSLEPRKLTLVHTGKLSGPWGRHPGNLFEALRRLQEEEPDIVDRLALLLAGRLDVDEQRLIMEAGLERIVRHVGVLSRGDAIALQRNADVLLLLTSPTLVWELPGKIFEYFGARRPILALAKDNEAARLVAETGTGWTVAPDDIDAIVARLKTLLGGEATLEYDDDRLAPYIYPAPVDVLEAEIERAVALRHRIGSAGCHAARRP